MTYNQGPPGSGYQYPPPTYQQQKPPQPAVYPAQPPGATTVTTHTVVLQQQPKVVVQPTVRSQTGDIFSSLGRAVDSMADDFVKAGKDVSRDVSNVVYNPIELLKPGYVVQIISKVCGKSLRVLENGLVDCAGTSGTSCEFVVVSALRSGSSIKLRNVAQPRFHLAIVNGFLVGHGQGGSDCDFIPTMSPDSHVTFESMSVPGSHIGVLPSGQITSPAQTDKLTDASHFKIKYLRKV